MSRRSIHGYPATAPTKRKQKHVDDVDAIRPKHIVVREISKAPADRILLATKLLAYRRADTLRHYKPNPTQLGCHKSQAQYRLLSGGNRSGKSTGMAAEITWALTGTHPYRPNFEGGSYLLVTTRRQQADLVWRKKLILDSELKDAPAGHGMIPSHKIASLGFSCGDGLKALKTVEMMEQFGGASLHVIWAGDMHAWKGIEGIQFDGVFIDENSVTMKLLEELSVRIRDAYDDPNKPGAGFIFWAATETKVQEAFTHFRQVCEDPDDPESAYFAIPDSQAVAVTVASGARAAKLMRKDTVRTRVDGTAGAMDLVRIYPQFDRDIHCIDAKYEFKPWDNIVMGYDPGMAHATGITLAAIRKDDPQTLHFFACFNLARQTIDAEVAWVKSQLGFRQICRLVYDPSARAAQKAAGGKNISQVLAEAIRANELLHAKGLIRYGQNAHALGIRKVRDMLDKMQFIVYLQGDGCETLAMQMTRYMGRPETNYTGVHGVVKKDDDLCDPSRYLCAENLHWADYGPNYGDFTTEPINAEDAYVQKRVAYHQKRTMRRKRR